MSIYIYYYGIERSILEDDLKQISNVLNQKIETIQLECLDELPNHSCAIVGDQIASSVLEDICKMSTVIAISDKISKNEGMKIGLYGVLSPNNLDNLAYMIFNMIDRQNKLESIHKYINMFKFYSDVSDSLIYLKNNNGEYKAVNDKFLEITGLTRKEIIGKKYVNLWADTNDICGEGDKKVVTDEKKISFNSTLKTFQGLRQYRITKSPMYDFYGNVEAVLSYANDITNLIKEEAKLNLLLDNVPFAVGICDEKGIYRNVNSKMREIFDNAKIIGEKRGCLSSIYTVKEVNGRKEVVIFKGEKHFIYEMKETPIIENNIPLGEIVILLDITEQKYIEEKNREEAMTDMLTGLPNRRCLVDYYSALKPGSPVSFLFMDMDDFKSKNDKYGHLVGDEILKIASKMLLDTFKGAFISRLGGDEFVICITNLITRDELEKKLETLKEKGKRVFIEKQRLFETIKFSIGVIHEAREGFTLDEILEICDKAMYVAKASGKNTCVFVEHDNIKEKVM